MAPAEKVNILLVDDQPGKLLTYETILAGLDENLVKATHGQEALAHLLKTEFAVVLLDVCMPVIDGFALASMIRQHPRCERTAIIFISAVQMDDGDQLKGYELGGVDYMSVPVVPELLRARVAVFCDLYRKTRALERANRELEQRVAERTADLERDLAERKRLEKALIDSGRRKDEFLAMLAHELRNPLAPIRTAVDLLGLRPIDDPVVLECRDVIDRQITQLTHLVDDLLDVSRISSGKIQLSREPLEVTAIVDRAIETQRPVLDARRQKLTFLMPDQPLIVHGDLTRLSEAVGNLLNNASKYSDEGAPIVIRTEPGRSADGAPEAVIKVQDPGIGIPPDEVERVFELFTQLSNAAPRAQGGIGVGLALVRKLVELHGGQVSGRSAGLGRGSEFEIRLPLETAPRAASPPPSAAAAEPVPHRRILVVDDNRDAAETLATMLRLDGQDVRTAHDGAQALATAEQFRPELVLLDLGMPGVSGFDVARSIRSRPWGAGVVIVAQTGWGQEHDRRRTREAGFDEHVTKPVDRSRLMQLLGPNGAGPEPRRAA